MNDVNLHELLYQAIETELGGEKLYEAAIQNAVNADLEEEWGKYLEETQTHQDILARVFEVAGLDIDADSPGRRIVRQKGESLVAAVEASRAADDPKIGELVAAESVVEAESKDHQNWELLGRMVEHLDGDLRDALAEAYEEVADQEAEHLFHTMGWARELWLDYLGVPAVLPPPEEQKKVETQIGRATARPIPLSVTAADRGRARGVAKTKTRSPVVASRRPDPGQRAEILSRQGLSTGRLVPRRPPSRSRRRRRDDALGSWHRSRGGGPHPGVPGRGHSHAVDETCFRVATRHVLASPPPSHECKRAARAQKGPRGRDQGGPQDRYRVRSGLVGAWGRAGHG